MKKGYKNTEIGVIPEDWEVRGLEYCLIEKPKYGIGAAAVDYDFNYPTYLRITDIDDDGTLKKSDLKSVSHPEADNYYLNEGDIVFARTGASVGKTYLHKSKNGNLVYAGFLIKVSPNNEILKSDFLKSYTETKPYWKWVRINSMRSGQPGINGNEYGGMQIPVPPLPEQTAIATMLSDTDSLIQALEKKIAKKQLIKKGAMQKLLNPIENGQLKMDNCQFSTVNSQLKKGWVVKTLGGIAKYRRGSFPQPYGLSQWYDENNGMPFVQVFDVDKNMKLKSTTKQRISELAKDKSVFVRKGSIILTIQGSIGRIAVTQYDAYVDRTLLIFTDYQIPMDVVFFSFIVQEKFRIEKGNAPGGIIKTITKEALSKFEISFPKSKQEQTRIAQILSDMDSEIEILEKKLAKYKELKQGLMQVLLTGKIRLLSEVERRLV